MGKYVNFFMKLVRNTKVKKVIIPPNLTLLKIVRTKVIDVKIAEII